MNDIKYIYFEVYSISGVEIVEPRLQNINALIFKPQTNSSGFWGYTNMTKRRNDDTFVWVHQNWVDIEKYNNKKLHHNMDNYIIECLKYLNVKLRKNKLEKIA